MTAAAPSNGTDRPRHPFRSWTLRTRIVAAVVALIALLGVVIGLVSVLFLQSYLVGRLDVQLERALDVGVRATQPGGGGPNDAVGVLGQIAGTLGARITNGDTINAVILGGSEVQSVPKLSSGFQNQMLAVPTDRHPVSADLGGSLGEYRLAAAALADGSELVIGLPMAEVNSTTSQLVFVILMVTLAGAIVAIGVGLVIVRLALRPLDRVVATASAVSELPLDRGEVALAVRVPEHDTDPGTEVGRVGASFNRMLGHVASALTARQASENKVRQFVADASHELRTPLASIRGYAELTRRGPVALPEETVRSIGRIESEAQRMTMLVEDLLLLARLDEGRALEREPVDLSRLLVDAVSDAHAAGPDHTWSIDLPGEPVEVIGDEPRLHQVIVNLLANARVHTPSGTAVTVTLAHEGSAAIVTVADDGPGIPEDLQPVLFERFARGDSSRSRDTGSTGLGLAIVHAVVEAQGGTVRVESEPGRTAFIVTLPSAAVTAPEHAEAAAQ